jgi:ATP phosphoribosyltransferase regulatory subunit HisZ
MMNKDSEKFTTTFQHYIVAYIDVLGQKAELAKLEKLLDNGERTGELVLKAKRQTIDVVKKIREDFLMLCKQREGKPENPRYHDLTIEQKAQFKTL